MCQNEFIELAYNLGRDDFEEHLTQIGAGYKEYRCTKGYRLYKYTDKTCNYSAICISNSSSFCNWYQPYLSGITCMGAADKN